MSYRGLFICSLFYSASVLAENPFDKAAREREVARQRAFDRGQKTALPAAEEREALGRLNADSMNAKRSAEGAIVNQGAPSAAVYNRVMETRRHFKDHPDPFLWNANDTFTDSLELAKTVQKEALLIYPDLTKPNSTFAMRFVAINRWVDSRQPPLAKDARRVLLVSHMVSLELAGSMARDSLGLAQVPTSEKNGTNKPAILIEDTFEIEVRGDSALLPNGLKCKVMRGALRNPDVIQWMDDQGAHEISLPQQTEGSVFFTPSHARHFRRIEMLNGDFRARFSLIKS